MTEFESTDPPSAVAHVGRTVTDSPREKLAEIPKSGWSEQAVESSEPISHDTDVSYKNTALDSKSAVVDLATDSNEDAGAAKGFFPPNNP